RSATRFLYSRTRIPSLMRVDGSSLEAPRATAVLVHGAMIAVIIALSFITWQQFNRWLPSRRETRHVLAARERSTYLRAAFWAREGDRLWRAGQIDAAA